jgi:predicted Zn-dependent protease
MKAASLLRGLAAALLALTLTGPVAVTRGADPLALPDFGSSADLVMSRGAERRLGTAFMRSVRAALPVIDDPLLTDYINSLGDRLATASGDGAGRYDFFLIDAPAVNAFAGPDGHIGVFAGLVLTTESESELAAVIAHEIAHVTQRHLMRAFEDQQRMSMPTAALMIAAAILGAQVDAQAGAAALAGVQAAAIQRRINFTRDNEKEADRIGISTLASAGFDPFAMPGFFERLSRATRIQESDAPELLRTHPVSTSRTADALGRAESYGHRQRPDDLRYHLTRADLRQRRSGNPEKAIAEFRATLASGRHRSEPAERYGLALALARGGQVAAATKLAGELLGEHPNQAELLVLDARLKVRAGRAGEAADALRTHIGLRPDNVPLRIAYAEALMAAGRPAQALETLEDLARRKPGRPEVYQLLSDAAGKSGRRLATHRYRAEYLYATGDLEPAIRQLEVALRQRDAEYYEASQVEARLQILRQEQKDLEGEDDFGLKR